jgi:hypothetical protein
MHKTMLLQLQPESGDRIRRSITDLIRIGVAIPDLADGPGKQADDLLRYIKALGPCIK